MRRSHVWLLAAAIGFGFAQVASAADMPVKAPIYKAPPPPYNWTGCYVGVFGGVTSGKVHHATASIADFAEYNTSGGLGGGDIGCNYQFNSFVLGAEGDFAFLGVNGDGFAPNPAYTLDARERWFATLRGRIGVAFDRLLPYVTGGVAWANWRHSETAPDGTSMESTKTLDGWVIGGGVEYAIDNNWLVKAEFLYADYGTDSFFDPASACTGCSTPQDIKHKNYVYKLGVNYKFY